MSDQEDRLGRARGLLLSENSRAARRVRLRREARQRGAAAAEAMQGVAIGGLGGGRPENPELQSEIGIGDYVQWTSDGIDQFTEPREVTAVFEDYVQVEGSATGLPIGELTLVLRGPEIRLNMRSAQKLIEEITLDVGRKFIEWRDGLGEGDMIPKIIKEIADTQQQFWHAGQAYGLTVGVKPGEIREAPEQMSMADQLRILQIIADAKDEGVRRCAQRLLLRAQNQAVPRELMDPPQRIGWPAGWSEPKRRGVF